VQGTAADGFKIALINLDGQIAGNDARIVHILHDEVIVEAPYDIADAVAVIIKYCMEKAFIDILPGVPFVVEPEIRESWG
jgi:DNA polymerase-1